MRWVSLFVGAGAVVTVCFAVGPVVRITQEEWALSGLRSDSPEVRAASVTKLERLATARSVGTIVEVLARLPREEATRHWRGKPRWLSVDLRTFDDTEEARRLYGVLAKLAGEALPELIACLESDAPAQRECAMFALSVLGSIDSRSSAKLLACLGDSVDEVRNVAFWVLGKDDWREGEVLGEAVAMIDDGDPPEPVVESITASVAVALRESMRAYEAGEMDVAEGPRRRWLDALLRWARDREPLVQAAALDKLVEFAYRYYEEDYSDSEWEALDVSAFESTFLDSLHHEDLRVSRAAASGLSKLVRVSDATREVIVDVVTDPARPAEVRSRLIYSIDDVVALPLLERAARFEDPKRRVALCEALGDFWEFKRVARRVLASLSEDEDPAVRSAANKARRKLD